MQGKNRPYRGHDLPRLRGAMIGHSLTPEDFDVLGRQWNANHVRWQLTWGGFPTSPADRADVKEYEDWLESALARLDTMLPVCRKAGLLVLIDLHTPPGGRTEQSLECRIFKERKFQEAFLRAWEKIARRYRDTPGIWGYGLVNEPSEGRVDPGLMDWRALAAETAKMVRKIDPQPAIIVEPAPWGGPGAMKAFRPLEMDRIVYSVHMYEPHDFTHQGVFGKPMGLTYRGVINGKLWTKRRLRETLQPVVDFQQRHNAHIYLGEFSAIRWSPGDSAVNYLNDCISLFEEFGWDWAYHAFREWTGWSVEHGPDPKDEKRSPTPTPRERLLRSWYAKNKKPGIYIDRDS